jgi:hypothetical protein
MEQKPSIGRVIVYNNPGSKDGTYPPTQSPALIVRVNEDGTVLAHIFTDKGSFIQPALSKAMVRANGTGPREYRFVVEFTEGPDHQLVC